MKTVTLTIASLAMGLMLSMAPADSEARRLGGGRAAGMQRQAPPPKPATPPNAAQNTPAATPGTAAATGAAAAGRRSWMGPIAGLAAGLGIAALLSHFGLGAGVANFLTMLLLAVAAVVAIRWLMRRFAGQRPTGGRLATAGGPGFGAQPGSEPRPEPMRFQSLAPAAGSAPATATAPMAGRDMPEGFDAAAFERIAKTIFVRMQAANDASQIDDLRKFTTPELFASLRVDLQDRGDAAQQTDVVKLDAEVLETVQEDGQWIVTVRFSGLIREEAGGGAQPFDEMWHLVKPVDDSREWAIAGITPTQ